MYYAVVPLNGAPLPLAAAVRGRTVPAAISTGSINVAEAHTIVEHDVTAGLAASSAYVVVLVAEDDEPVPNLQAGVRGIELQTLPDTTPPKWVPGFPATQHVEDFAYDLVIRLDEPSSCAYVTLYAGTGAPTVVDIMAGTDGDGTPAVASGRVRVVDVGGGTFEGVHTVTDGLAAVTEYAVHVVCWDDEDTANRQASAGVASVTTLPDSTPPVFLPGYPRSSSGTIEDFAVELQAALDEPATWYFVVQPLGSEIPAPAQIMAGQGAQVVVSDHVQVLVDRVPFMRQVSEGLSAATAFQVCSVAADDEPTPNMQSRATVFNFTTLPDATPPRWTAHPRMSRIEDFTLGFTVVLDEPGSVLWLITRAGALAPTVAALRAGRDGGGLPGLDSGAWSVHVGGVEATIVITGKLEAETSYDVFVAAEVRARCVLPFATSSAWLTPFAPWGTNCVLCRTMRMFPMLWRPCSSSLPSRHCPTPPHRSGSRLADSRIRLLAM